MSNTIPNTQPSIEAPNTTAGASLKMPEHISLDKWADSGFTWAGEHKPSSFERLAAELATEREQNELQISAKLYRQDNVLHFSFNVAGEVWLTCQRCLQPVAIDLTDTYDIALLEDESQVGLIDDNEDYLLLDEVITEQTPEQLLPFKKLIEDEILLKIPLAPKHDDCEMIVDQVGEIPEEEGENPFAALASLKGKLPK